MQLYKFLFLSRMAGARVWFTRWLAGYRCVWLKAVPGWASRLAVVESRRLGSWSGANGLSWSRVHALPYL